MARAARPGHCKAGLQRLLGEQGCARLQRVLLARAAAWAQEVAPGRVHVAAAPSGAGDELASLMGRVDVFDQQGDGHGQRLAQASTRVFECHDGPLLVIGTAVPALGGVHARSALDDLAAGCDLSLGPTTGGSCYLLALAGPQPTAMAGLDDPADEPLPLLARTLAAATGLRLGLLRSERELVTEADARALVCDPLTPGEVRDALRSCAGSP